MNRTVSWSRDGAKPSGRAEGDGRDEGRAPAVAPTHDRPDHTAEMKAIASQLERLSGAFTRDGADRPETASGRLAALRQAVAAIARRQADLDGGEPAVNEAAASEIAEAAPAPSAPAPSVPTPSGGPAPTAAPRGPAGIGRSRADLSEEVSQTFARFSRDLADAIQAADARPSVEALGQEVRQIGRAIDGIGNSLPKADDLARIGEQTREMRDLLKSSTARSGSVDAMQRQVASLEGRLGQPATQSTPAGAPPDFSATMAEVRALLDGFNPGATMAAFETRLDAITDRLERGLDAQGSSGLIEGLSRRVDEIHASLRSQLAESAIDTRPLEGLVRGLSDRIGQARSATTDLHQLETVVRDAAAKIDGAAAGLDPRAVQAVEQQLARLGERLDRSEASLRALDGVEHTLGELFSQFEVTRQVAIDAAETAARTAARDTLRAALQNPALAHRGSDVPSAAVDQMARSLDDIRVLQDTSERRTQSALSDIQIAMDRLAQQMAGGPGRAPSAFEEARRARTLPDPTIGEAPVPPAGADDLIEPGLGRGFVGRPTRSEPRVEADAEAQAPTPTVENDGPASFIAAARRAAQAAQASAASAAAVKATERPTAPRRAAPRARPMPVASDNATLTRARLFLAQRRRPVLLGLAALVLLVGALEVVKLGADTTASGRTGQAATQAGTRVASAATSFTEAAPAKAADLPKPVLPPASAPTPAPLPTFVTGSKAPAPADGIAEGLRTAAASGDASAQYEIGLRYSEGRGVARDAKQAVAWFAKAAAQGSAPAEYRLGSAYEKGVGVERDPALAMGWYLKAADIGNIRAMHNLAVMAAEGAAGKPDYAKAAQWFNKASTFGVRDSQFNLAILYARGLGIEQSLPQSYTWFAIAAGGGDEDAAKKRDEVAAKLDAKALETAKAAADAFHAATALPAANEVTPPAGGWDAPASRGSGSPASAGAKISQL